MIKKTYSKITKEVTKVQLWKLISDVNHWTNWNNSVEKAEFHGTFKTGTFFTLKPKGGPQVEIQLVDVQPDRYFKDCTRFPLAKMYGEHTYEDAPAGLKLTITMTITGPLARLWNHLVMKDIVNHLPQDIENQINAAKQL